MDSEAEARRSTHQDRERIEPKLDRPFRIARWRVDPLAGRMTRGEREVRLEPKAMRLLALLAHHRGQTVTRRELMATVWPDVVVGDDSLNRAISYLRRKLGNERGGAGRLIETIPTIGYRLIVEAPPLPLPSDREAAPGMASRAGRVRSPRRWAMIAVFLAGALTVAGLAWIGVSTSFLVTWRNRDR